MKHTYYTEMEVYDDIAGLQALVELELSGVCPGNIGDRGDTRTTFSVISDTDDLVRIAIVCGVHDAIVGLEYDSHDPMDRVAKLTLSYIAEEGGELPLDIQELAETLFKPCNDFDHIGCLQWMDKGVAE